MRITNGRRAKRKRFVCGLDFFIDHLAAAPDDRNFIAPKTDAAHFDANGFAPVEHGRSHWPPQSLNGKLASPHCLLVPQVTRENSQAVAAFLRFTAVGVKDAES